MRMPWHGLDMQARRGLLAHALYWQAAAIAFQFVNIYIFRLSHGYAKPALYQIWSNGCIPAGFALGSWIARRRSSSATFRSGLLVFLFFLIAMLVLRERCVEWIPLIGLLSGLAIGLYWQGWTLVMMDLSENHQRDAMLGTSQWVYYVAYLTSAPLAGWFLSRFSGLEGYSWVFAVATLMLAMAWIVSLPLKTSRLHGGGSFKRLMKARKPAGWGYMAVSAMLTGLFSVSAMFLSILISYEAKGSETGTGSYNFLNAACGFVAAWVISRSAKPRNRLRILWISALVTALFTLPLALNRGFLMILLYGAGMAVTLCFYNVPLFSTHLRIIDDAPRFKARRADALTFREIFIDGGRVLGYAFVMLAVTNIDSASLSWFFVAIAVLPLINTWLMRRFV